MTGVTATGIQFALARDTRLADEPLGPSEPETPADYRAHCTLTAGDRVYSEISEIAGTVLGRVPAPGADAGIQEWVHIEWDDGVQSQEPADSLGRELYHDDLEVRA